MTTVSAARACAAALALVAWGGVVRADDTGLAASMHDLGRQGGRLCMLTHAHNGNGDGATKAAALASALKSWFEYTAWEYGTDWARWSKSASKKISYTKAASGWSAAVEARPCK